MFGSCWVYEAFLEQNVRLLHLKILGSIREELPKGWSHKAEVLEI